MFRSKTRKLRSDKAIDELIYRKLMMKKECCVRIQNMKIKRNSEK